MMIKSRKVFRSLCFNSTELAADVAARHTGEHIHVDEKADFPGEKTPFALSIGETDNIDRFDAYHLYEGLHFADYMNLPLDKQREFADKHLAGLMRLLEEPFATQTSATMRKDRVNYQIGFYKRLKDRIEKSF